MNEKEEKEYYRKMLDEILDKQSKDFVKYIFYFADEKNKAE